MSIQHDASLCCALVPQASAVRFNKCGDPTAASDADHRVLPERTGRGNVWSSCQTHLKETPRSQNRTAAALSLRTRPRCHRPRTPTRPPTGRAIRHRRGRILRARMPWRDAIRRCRPTRTRNALRPTRYTAAHFRGLPRSACRLAGPVAVQTMPAVPASVIPTIPVIATRPPVDIAMQPVMLKPPSFTSICAR